VARQDSLFSDSQATTQGIALGIPGSAPTLSSTQKRFNKLLDEIAALRQRLVDWQEFPERYRRRVEKQLLPLEARLRGVRVELANVLDRSILGKGLTKREKSIAQDLLEDLLDGLLDEAAPDPELLALAARHGFDLSTEDDIDPLEAMRSFGNDAFGVDIGADHGAATPEELAALFAERLDAEEAEREAQRKPRRKSAKMLEREAEARQLAEDAGKAVREIYRKLARDLHPDRIADDAERQRKTALMQDANLAYEARDLLALLELQWKIEQIDPAHMASVPDKKLRHFIHLLQEQVQSLHDEIEDVAFPYLVHFEGMPPRDVRPLHVEQAVKRQATELRHALSEQQRDLRRYGDLAELKRDLKEFGRAPDRDDFDAMLEALMQTMPTIPRTARTARKPAKKRRR
jgi:curved DNA-binding protein CbpA